MEITDEIRHGLNVALNEAKLLGLEFHGDRELAAATFAPVALDESGKVPDDNRVQFVFKPVGRLMASYRLGAWNDPDATVIKFDPDSLFDKVTEFGGCPIYGWEFIDCSEEPKEDWIEKLSCKFEASRPHGRTHTITLFQEGGGEKHIDIKIWFDDIELFTPQYEPIPLGEFIANGKRGWDSIYNGEGSKTFAIFPLSIYPKPGDPTPNR
jgi:hypothetical protein